MPVYLISRIADPLFALTMGVTAALTRIRRDQREKNPERASEISYGTVVQTGGQRLQRWWNGDFQDGLINLEITIYESLNSVQCAED
ncbi:hypothetical protein PENANT_c045G09358 [Penicillium antarcticum]|uniref:Uncharacterized protein n=1 Tax=Penicillium antarcticum TaxID=416450 RepID=A0A1V6PT80_9EURO|nr:hypothetical protein PENANT_c045G09358 [Penicillium antarcticum]